MNNTEQQTEQETTEQPSLDTSALFEAFSADPDLDRLYQEATDPETIRPIVDRMVEMIERMQSIAVDQFGVQSNTAITVNLAETTIEQLAGVMFNEAMNRLIPDWPEERARMLIQQMMRQMLGEE